MILPIITLLSREVFLQTPVLHQEAALALGATRWEMVKMTVLPFGRAGIVSSVMLGLGRALGETMAVAMGASVRCLGDQPEILTSQNPNTIAADRPELSRGVRPEDQHADVGGLVLFVITLVVNMIARLIVGRYKEFLGGQLMSTITASRTDNPLTAGQLPRYAPWALGAVALIAGGVIDALFSLRSTSPPPSSSVPCFSAAELTSPADSSWANAPPPTGWPPTWSPPRSWWRCRHWSRCCGRCWPRGCRASTPRSSATRCAT